MYVQICNREIEVETVEDTAASNIKKKIFLWKKKSVRNQEQLKFLLLIWIY